MRAKAGEFEGQNTIGNLSRLSGRNLIPSASVDKKDKGIGWNDNRQMGERGGRVVARQREVER